MGGRASPFGIDEEDLDDALIEILRLPHLKVVGLHLFMATQILDADTLIRQYERALTIARHVAGDLFGVFLSGAYARTSSPLGFLSHDAPGEVLGRCPTQC